MTKLSIQDVIDGFGESATWRTGGCFIWGLTFRLAGPVVALSTNFAGFLPYEQWHCLPNSTDCEARVEENGISRKSFCGIKNQKKLIPGTDMIWELDGRKTYAVDWDLLCDREYLGTFVSSSFFVGALFALLVSSALFDRFGRIHVMRITQILALITLIIMIFASSLWYLIGVRLIYGGLYMIANTGYHVLTLELTPARYRSKVVFISLQGWTVGYFFLVLIAWSMKDYRYLLGFATLLLSLNLYLIFCILPESPMHLLSNRRDETATKIALNKLARFFESDETFEDDSIVENHDQGIENQEAPSFLDTLKDFIKYPVMTKHVFILLFNWCAFAWLYYGFAYSWGKFGSNIYLSYFLNGCGEILSSIILYFYFEKCKRRITAYFNFGVTAALLVAMTPDNVRVGPMTISQMASLIGVTLDSVVFAAYFLVTQELSPTTHRGRILSLSSSSARIGSLLGPQASLLFNWNKQATFGIFAAVAFVSGALMLQFPETQGRAMPSQAHEIISRSEQIRLKKEAYGKCEADKDTDSC